MNNVRFARVVCSLALLVLVWGLTSGRVFVTEIVPPPLEVFGVFSGMVADGEIFNHLIASFRRIGVGYFLGCTIGILLGISMGASRLAKDLIDPPFEFFRNIPPVALVPLMVSLFGIGETGKYVLISYSVIIAMTINTAAGVAATPQIRIRAAQCLGAGKRDIFLRVVLPSAWPYVLTGLRISLGFAFTAVVAAEMLAASEGIGFLIMQSTNLIQPEEMFIGFFMLGIFGLLTDQAFRAIINRLMHRYMITMEGAQ